MRFLFTIILVGLATVANAQTGMFYNPDRSGEGIIVTLEGDTLAFAFFTHFDPDAANRVLPTVSPAPPAENIVLPECIAEITEVPGVVIPPVVSPRPPAGAEVDTTRYGGIPIWYIGYGAYADGIALGEMYLHKPISYPYSFDGLVTDEYAVATFLMSGDGEGFKLQLDCYKNLPSTLYMCNNVMTFNRLLIGQ